MEPQWRNKGILTPWFMNHSKYPHYPVMTIVQVISETYISDSQFKIKFEYTPKNSNSNTLLNIGTLVKLVDFSFEYILPSKLNPKRYNHDDIDEYFFDEDKKKNSDKIANVELNPISLICKIKSFEIIGMEGSEMIGWPKEMKIVWEIESDYNDYYEIKTIPWYTLDYDKHIPVQVDQNTHNLQNINKLQIVEHNPSIGNLQENKIIEMNTESTHINNQIDNNIINDNLNQSMLSEISLIEKMIENGNNLNNVQNQSSSFSDDSKNNSSTDSTTKNTSMLNSSKKFNSSTNSNTNVFDLNYSPSSSIDTSDSSSENEIEEDFVNKNQLLLENEKTQKDEDSIFSMEIQFSQKLSEISSSFNDHDSLSPNHSNVPNILNDSSTQSIRSTTPSSLTLQIEESSSNNKNSSLELQTNEIMEQFKLEEAPIQKVLSDTIEELSISNESSKKMEELQTLIKHQSIETDQLNSKQQNLSELETECENCSKESIQNLQTTEQILNKNNIEIEILLKKNSLSRKSSSLEQNHPIKRPKINPAWKSYFNFQHNRGSSFKQIL